MVMNEIRAAEKVFIAELLQNSQQKQLQPGKRSECAYLRSPPLRGLLLKMTEPLPMNSINSFSAWEKNTVANIPKLAKESNYTLGQCSFVPRTYPLSEQFTFKATDLFG